MPFVFRIHKQTNGNAPDAAHFTSGWDDTTLLSGALLDEIPSGHNVGRMGTSIPSIFARICLFNTAFDAIVPGTYDKDGLNQMLTSEVLDMLEFLYLNANSSKLSTIEWVSAQQIDLLNNNELDELQRLGATLQTSMEKIGNPANITLYVWEDTNSKGEKVKTIIGGTSLSTLVFTSPNWTRKMSENGWAFNGLDGGRLFEGKVKSLQKRNRDFREMIFKLRMAYVNEFREQCDNKAISKYIWETMNQMGINVTSDKQKFGTIYKPIKNTYAGIIPIPFKPVTPDQSGYKLRATSQRYVNQLNPGGAAVAIPTPLILNDTGLPGVVYVGDSYWKPSYKIDEAHVRITPFIADRQLPGEMGIRYPYLTTSDFLEDSIIEVPGNIDSTRFFTLFNGESKYLLPLKRQFFDFFNIEDLDGILNETGKKLVDISSEDGKVKVTINVPITDAVHRSIPLSKEYKESDIVRQAKRIEIGFFPFYKVINNPSLNKYSVMLASMDGVGLNFYSLNPQSIQNVVAHEMTRTRETAFYHTTKYYDVTSAIDIVEVVLTDGKKAIVLPRMKTIQTGALQYRFAIDFGTSNSYIAYKTDNQAEIKTLAFGETIDGTNNETDAQTVFLYNPANQNLAKMVDTFQREFMLPTIGLPDSIASFPIKTSVCEVTQFENQSSLNLFGNINVGFKFKNEISAGNLTNASYFTNLKWVLESEPGSRVPGWRVLAFCKQLLWLVKNKALLNGGNENFTVMLTFPEAMIDRSVFLDVATQSGVWIEAARELGLNAANMFMDDVSESEAPYYKVVTDNNNLLNIDIGGGTTDMFLVRRLDKDGNPIVDEVDARYLSIKFAADDLWGDGTGARRNTVGNNGFCQYLTQKIAQNGADVKSITNMVTRSADVMAALFSNEDKFKTSLLIRQNNVLRSVLLIHYTALLFAASRLLTKLDAGIPNVISFTGMGSKYLSLISTNQTRLKNFTADVLRLLTGFKIPIDFKLDTHYADAKEITARGALEKTNVQQNYHIPNGKKKLFTDLGYETTDILSYKQVRVGEEVSKIRKEARITFDQFVSFLKSDEFNNLIGREFEISIPEYITKKLSDEANGSFNNIQGGLSAAHDQKTITDNLFFWFLKDSLCKLSTLYNQDVKK